jgi:hypothetical protein
LVSDATFSGEIREGAGPYQFLNTVALRSPDRPAISIIVRQSWVIETPIEMNQTDDAAHHGGTTLEELAAILSLGLGVRCRSAGLSRLYGFGSADPLGMPIAFDQAHPYLPEPSRQGPMLPGMNRHVNLADLAPLLSAYRAAPAAAARTLVRAARMYQQGIWVADDTANLSWLYLVGAAETAATTWQLHRESPAELLTREMPELVTAVAPTSSGHLDQVAKLLAHLVKSQTKFIQFMVAHGPPPPPPADRPPEWAQFDWSQLEGAMRQIYGYRSKALHEGIPFPEPMCHPPTNTIGRELPPLERPLGLAIRVGESVWTQEAYPMCLATFEYLVRGALQRWWLRLSDDSSS